MIKIIMILLLVIQWRHINAQVLKHSVSKPTQIIDSFYIFDFFSNDLYGRNVPGIIGCDSVIVTINNGQPIILKAKYSNVFIQN